jgi:hypothetical protein
MVLSNSKLAPPLLQKLSILEATLLLPLTVREKVQLEAAVGFFLPVGPQVPVLGLLVIKRHGVALVVHLS